MEKKNARKTRLETRRELARQALPEVRKLVKKFDLAAVNKAVKVIYDERTAANELRAAERKVQELRRKLA